MSWYSFKAALMWLSAKKKQRFSVEIRLVELVWVMG